jgi:hypothetical protein
MQHAHRETQVDLVPILTYQGFFKNPETKKDIAVGLDYLLTYGIISLESLNGIKEQRMKIKQQIELVLLQMQLPQLSDQAITEICDLLDYIEDILTGTTTSVTPDSVFKALQHYSSK